MKLTQTQNRMKAQDYLLLLIIFLVPLVLGYHKSPLSPMESALTGRGSYIDLFNYWKQIVLVVLSTGVFLLMAMDWLLGSRETYSKRTITVLGLFTVAIILAGAMSIDKTVALRGVIDRYEGVWSWLSYITIIVAAYEAVRRSEAFRKLFPAVLLVSAGIIAVIGILQYYGITVLNQDIIRYAVAPDDIARGKSSFFVETGFPVGTLSNPNYLGGYMGAVVLLAFWQSFKAEKPGMQFLFGSTSSLLLATLVASRSSAGLLGFSVAIPALLYLGDIRFGHKRTLGIFGFSVVGCAAILLAKSTNLLISGELIYEAVFVVLAASWLILRGKRLIPIVFKRQTLVLLLIIVAVGGVTGGYFYGQKRLENPQYLHSVKIEGNRLMFNFTVGRLNLVYQNGLILPQSDDGQEIRTLVETVSEKQKVYQIEDKTFGFAKYAVSDEKDFKVLQIQPYNILFIATPEGLSWIDTSRSPKTINNTSFPLKGIESIGSGRGYIWGRTVMVAPKHFLVGAGPDNFIFVFPQDDPAGKAMMGGANLYIDKPHNLYLKILIEFGLLGLISLGWLLLRAIKYGIIGGFSHGGREIFAVSAVVLLSFCVSSVFNDSLPSITPVMMAFIGFSLAGETESVG